MNGNQKDSIRINHKLQAINEVEKYVDEVSYDQFYSNSEKKFAALKQIEIIGEACGHLSMELKSVHPQIDWRVINGSRNISVHEYFGIDFKIVWEIIQNDLPVLKRNFSKIHDQNQRNKNTKI